VSIVVNYTLCGFFSVNRCNLMNEKMREVEFTHTVCTYLGSSHVYEVAKEKERFSKRAVD
jgi:hypothetical protein